MKKKLSFLMLILVAMVASISLTSCDKVENNILGDDYYIQLVSVETNLMNADGQWLDSTLKEQWIEMNNATADGRLKIGKLTLANAEKEFEAIIASLTSQYDELYADKDILPEQGKIIYFFALVQSGSAKYKTASIIITNSGATSNI